jgi:hypothetical protein
MSLIRYSSMPEPITNTVFSTSIFSGAITLTKTGLSIYF